VRAIVNIAHDLGLRTIAEGIEDAMALERLANLGCDAAQGFLISRALPADEFARWMEMTPGVGERRLSLRGDPSLERSSRHE